MRSKDLRIAGFRPFSLGGHTSGYTPEVSVSALLQEFLPMGRASPGHNQ